MSFHYETLLLLFVFSQWVKLLGVQFSCQDMKTKFIATMSQSTSFPLSNVPQFNIDILFEIYYWAMYDAIMQTTRIPADTIEMHG